ncbi:unnamed protein product, partial [Rotaria magnacalcarata]
MSKVIEKDVSNDEARYSMNLSINYIDSDDIKGDSLRCEPNLSSERVD